MNVQDRVHVRVLLVDLPVLDRVDRDAARLDARRNAEDDLHVLGVVAGDEQDVTARYLELRLVDAAGAHPEARLVLAGREVAVGEPADPVEPLDVAQVVLVDELLDGERGGEQPELVEPPAGLRDGSGDLVTVPQLRLEIGPELVVDHEPRASERLEPPDDRVGERGCTVVGGHEVAAPLERREPDAVPGDVGEGDVGESADEHRVALPQRVGRRRVEHVERRDERPAGAAAERLRALDVDDVQHELRRRALGRRLEPRALERGAELRDELAEGPGGDSAGDDVSHTLSSLRARTRAHMRKFP